MKTQTYPRKSTTGTSAGTKKSPKNGETTQTQEGGVIAIGPDLQEHLQKLQEVSAVASKIFALLGEQITSASYTIPVQRGYETVQYSNSTPHHVADQVQFFVGNEPQGPRQRTPR